MNLTISFAGICTHFSGVIAGIPHRVVLPDATQFRTGLISVGDEPPVLYYLTPHFAVLRTVPSGRVSELTIPGIMCNGNLQAGVRLQVMNAVNREMRLDNHYLDKTPQLSTYAPAYNYSNDVVLDGRAACYLDLFGGTVSSRKAPKRGGPRQVIATMETDGPPRLLVTPLHPDGGVPTSHVLTLRGVSELTVANLEFPSEYPADHDRGSFDYLLHFLTSGGGIPITIAKCTPGMKDPPRPADPLEIGEALTQLGKALGLPSDASPGLPSDAALARIQPTPSDLTVSCSDSRYP